MRVLILFAVLISGFGAMSARAQSPVEITFADGAKISVLDSYLEGKKNKIESVAEKEFTAEFYSIRKANYVFNTETLRSLSKKYSSLAGQIGKINSAYEIKQDGETYGFAAFNSIDYGKFKNCTGKSAPCKIKCKAFVITVDNDGEKKSVLVIKSIVKIK